MKLSPSLIVTSLCLSALTASVARAQEAPAMAHDRYKSLVESWEADARRQMDWLQGNVVGKAKDEYGAAWTEEEILAPLRDKQKWMADSVKRIDAAAEDLASRKITLVQFWGRIHAAMEQAAIQSAGVAIDRAIWEVRLLQRANIESRIELDAQYDRDRDRLAETLSGKELDAAVAELRQGYVNRERKQLEHSVAEYAALTGRFCARRGELCGELWGLVEFANAAGRKSDAENFEARLRGCWDYDKPRHDSMVDFFANMPGSPDRLILRKSFVKDFETLHKMNAALAAAPVEGFRGGRGEKTPEFQGTPMEQVARTLSARLVEFYELTARQEAAWRRLAELNAEARRTEGTLPDIAAVTDALAAFQTEEFEVAERTDARRRATEALAAANEALTQAESALRRTQVGVYLTGALRVVPAGTAGSQSAAALIQSRMRAIAAHEATLRDESLPADQRKAMEEVTIPRIREEIATIERAVARASERQETARVEALASRDAARTRLDALPAPEAGKLARLWSEFRDLYTTAREALPETERRGVAEIEAGRTAEVTAAAGRNLNVLRERCAALGTGREDVRRRLEETLAAIRTDELTLRELGLRIVNIRVSALVTAEAALESLGVGAQDEVTLAIGRLKDQLQKAQGIFARADDCTRALDEALQRDPLEVRKQIVGALRERLGIAGETLGILGNAAEATEAIRSFSNDIGNERTALRAVSTLLDFSANGGEAVPVLGAVLAPMMKIYGFSAAAACDAAIAIQDHVIEDNIRNLFDRPRPEQHLYTLREVAASCSLFSEDAHQRITTMLQARRLLALAGADTASEARDAR